MKRQAKLSMRLLGTKTLADFLKSLLVRLHDPKHALAEIVAGSDHPPKPARFHGAQHFINVSSRRMRQHVGAADDCVCKLADAFKVIEASMWKLSVSISGIHGEVLG